ncbi:MAG: EamA family transporter [Gammaproteobacteria bacterium]|nr:EamA family transporter [Gammaproteobacteria bacterium]
MNGAATQNAQPGDGWGVLACAAAAMLFACKGIFAKKLYALGVGVEGVVAIRAMISLPLFWWFALRREPWSQVAATPRQAVVMAALAGALCYYVGALLDFLALTMIDASIERVLIFSYPAMVVIFTSARDRSWPARSVLGATALTYLGIFFTMGGFDLAELRANLFGALLVIGSALSYAIYFMISEKYTRSVGSARFTLLAMSAATFCLAPHYFMTHGTAEMALISAEGWLLLVGIAVFCMFLPASLQAEGVRRIGAQRGAVMSTVGPPTTVVLAALLLGERLSSWQWAGMALIVLGILVLDLARTRRS